ncbi:MAG: hypothetical protein SCH71_10180 [Desulfobulbaceae bacterium]|nr:hypothetical protein [Desulfobulbaceae bacterium]
MTKLQIENWRKCSTVILVVFLLLSPVISGKAQDADSAYRADLIEMIVAKWQDTSEETGSARWWQGIRVWLERLDTDELTAALDTSDYEDLRSMLVSADPPAVQAEGLDTTLALGTFYYPLDPCRIVDTRTASGIFSGPVSSGTVADYYARDSLEQADLIAEQGGRAGGCGVPADAEAVVVNITATEQAGVGHLRAYPWGIAIPGASILNFAGSNIANSTILPLCTTTCSYDFSIYASRSTHVVIDVMGYFAD